MIELRPYQKQAVDACYSHLRNYEDNPVIVLPTGSGKTPVIATICNDAVNIWNGRVLILAHVKELLEQTAGTLSDMAPELNVGIYSAGLKRKDMHHPVIVAGIQSVYRKAFDIEPFDIVIIDEAHMLQPDGEGMYRSFLNEAHIVNPNIRIVGMTATPFRMTTGLICRLDHFLNSICYEIGIKELIRDGYLCPLRSKASKTRIDTSGIHIRGGEFIAAEMEDFMDTDTRVKAACSEIVEYTGNRHTVLIFAAGIAHGKHIVRVLNDEHNIECGFVSGDSPDGWRKKMLNDFKSGKLKYLCNVNVLTTGFDAPNIDCVVLLRPTMSPGLFYQMTGRGFRLHQSKDDCLILDFGGNILRHGPVDCLRITDAKPKGDGGSPVKECPQCCEVIHAAYARCPACGFEFPPPEKSKHDTTASAEGVLSGEVTIEEYDVQEVFYNVHTKKGANADAPRSMRVQYRIGVGTCISEWVCFEHSGFAGQKAQGWWMQRSDEPVPDSSELAVHFAQQGRLREPVKIIVKSISGEKFDRITGYHFDNTAADDWQLNKSEPQYVPADDDLPF
jgi:DNA repair protein RadD